MRRLDGDTACEPGGHAVKAIIKLLGELPPKAWTYIFIFFVLCAGYAYEHHRIYAQGVASMQAKVDAATLRAKQAEAANHGSAATIAALQMSQAQCESGRIADQVAANKAVTDHDQAAALIHAQLLADKAKIQALFDRQKNADCANWSQQAACTP